MHKFKAPLTLAIAYCGETLRSKIKRFEPVSPVSKSRSWSGDIIFGSPGSGFGDGLCWWFARPGEPLESVLLALGVTPERCKSSMLREKLGRPRSGAGNGISSDAGDSCVRKPREKGGFTDASDVRFESVDP